MAKVKTYELVAPDGGYGYIILTCVFVNLSMLSAYINCYGIIYKDFFSELGMDSTNITSLNGINSMSSAIGSLMTSFFLKRLSKRKMALIGATLWNTGLFCTVFAQSKIILFIFQGVAQSLGQGIIFNISSTALNDYFVKKRSLAVSVSQTLLAVLCLVAPQFFKWSINVFGYRNSLIWLCALSVHMIIAATLTQPVSWHMKKIEISPKEQELKILLNENNINHTTKALTDCTSIDVDRLQNITEDSKQKKIGGFLNDLIDFKLIKGFLLSIECGGATLVMTVEFIFLMILPQALQSCEFNWSEDDTAMAFTLVAVGDLSMRILMIVFDKLMNKWGSRSIYVFGIMLAFVTRIGILTSNSQILTFILLTLMGMSRCIILVVIILVVSESVKEDEFSAAIGIFMSAMGILNLTIGPLLGAIRDYTDSYIITFYLMTAIMGAVGVLWILKNICVKKRKSLH
ncbi:unnamed protein product [Pieris macdunnoughi]|uniref:Major facilitator superfamily (MFS) profile domain-containing protein n=1 Tax=Pieris macdunnoughi TaxID=345717 RepID=A0A821NYG6_9NEOP|nr:unnamed protein product [Pieris macdunnoughi]